MFLPFSPSISLWIQRTARLSVAPGILIEDREEPGSWISLLGSRVHQTQAPIPFHSRPQAALHHCVALLWPLGARSLTCERHRFCHGVHCTGKAHNLSKRESLCPAESCNVWAKSPSLDQIRWNFNESGLQQVNGVEIACSPVFLCSIIHLHRKGQVGWRLWVVHVSISLYVHNGYQSLAYCILGWGVAPMTLKRMKYFPTTSTCKY